MNAASDVGYFYEGIEKGFPNLEKLKMNTVWEDVEGEETFDDANLLKKRRSFPDPSL